MKNIEKLMEDKNAEYYSARGKNIYHDFKTFAGSKKLGKACAIEFIQHAQKTEGELLVYEVGIGGGEFALNFMKNITQMDSTIAKNITYLLWDLSGKLLDGAEEKLKGFSVEKIRARAEETEKMKTAFWIRGNEILDDIPSRVFFRKSRKIYEIGINNGSFCGEEKTGVPKEVVDYIANARENYWIPVNLRAENILKKWKNKLMNGGQISVLDYGFNSLSEIKEPPEIWNDSVIRKYGGEYTVDVNFDFLLNTCGGKLETQDKFVNKNLGEKIFAVETGEKMDYLNNLEIELERKNLKKEGYDIDLLKTGKETNEYYHYTISA